MSSALRLKLRLRCRQLRAQGCTTGSMHTTEGHSNTGSGTGHAAAKQQCAQEHVMGVHPAVSRDNMLQLLTQGPQMCAR